MTFQQLEYIIAVDKSRHFVNAATACGVTQSTLSTTIAKFEQEIDVIIFDRSKHPIEPTPMGKRIIQQAEVILRNSSELRQLVQSERDEEHGQLRIGMGHSVAPVLVPRLIPVMQHRAPNIEPHIHEHNPQELVEQLQRSETDMILTATSDLTDTNLLTIELWTERFVLYISPASQLYQRETIRPEDLYDGGLWVMRDFHDRYPQLAEITHRYPSSHQLQFEAGNLYTLLSMVDSNGGYTFIPESFSLCLSAEQQKHMRKVNSGKLFRSICLAIRQDYMREGMLNIITDAVKQIIPADLLSERLKKFDKVKI